MEEEKKAKKRKKKEEKEKENRKGAVVVDGVEYEKEEVEGAMDAFAKKTNKPAPAVPTIVGGKRRVVKKRMVEKVEADEKGYLHTTNVEVRFG